MKSKLQSLIDNKQFLYLVIIVLIILLFLSLLGNKSQENKVGVDSVEMQIFYSESPRDENKREEYRFSEGDPIQAKLLFNSVEKDIPLTLEVSDGKGNSVQSTEFILTAEKANENPEGVFVNINGATSKGTYRVVLKNENGVVARQSFRIN